MAIDSNKHGFPAPWEEGRGQLLGHPEPFKWSEDGERGVCRNPIILGYTRSGDLAWQYNHIEVAKTADGWIYGYNTAGDEIEANEVPFSRRAGVWMTNTKTWPTMEDAAREAIRVLAGWLAEHPKYTKNKGFREMLRRAEDKIQPTLF